MPREYRFELGNQIIRSSLAAADVLKDTKLITKDEFDKIMTLVNEISKQLGGFKKIIMH